MGLSEDYARSASKLALESIPSPDNQANYEAGPFQGQTDYLDLLDRVRFRRENETVEEKVMGQLGNLPGPGEAILGLGKLPGLIKLAKGFYPYAYQQVEAIGKVVSNAMSNKFGNRMLEQGIKPYEQNLFRVGNVLRSAGKMPAREWGRIHDVKVTTELGEDIAGQMSWPRKVEGIRKPDTMLLSEEGAYVTTPPHEVGIHARQMYPQEGGGYYTIDLEGFPKKQLHEADVADLLWRVRSKYINALKKQSDWQRALDPVEIHAGLADQEFARLSHQDFPSSKAYLEKWDEIYRESMSKTLEQTFYKHKDLFKQSLRELLDQYPSKTFPIVP